MEAFVRVVDTGSFSAAALQLRAEQLAVSKAIAQRAAAWLKQPWQIDFYRRSVYSQPFDVRKC
jgi:hypothetical protein